MKYFLIAIAILIFLFIVGVYRFRKMQKTYKLTADDYKYMHNLKIIQNKDCYSMHEIQKAQQEIDLYLERKKANLI